jgi:DNA-binding XRE family transcriptional regulator
MLKNVRKFREGRGWTRAELAERAGISGLTVYNAELGERGCRVETAVAIAKALGVTVDDLLGTRRRRAS